MSVKQRPVRRRKVAGHNRPRPAAEEESKVERNLKAGEEVAAEAAEHKQVAEEEPEGPAEEEPTGQAVETADSDPDATRRPKLPLALVIAAALLVGAGVFFMVKAQTADTGMDTKAMTEVNGQVKAGLEKIFSFSYDKVDPNVAHDVLAGQAVGEYDKLIQQVRTLAPEQKLVLATRVTTTGVKSIEGDKAELLVFLDQVATRVDTGKTNGSAAALSVTAEKQDGVWKIVSLIPR